MKGTQIKGFGDDEPQKRMDYLLQIGELSKAAAYSKLFYQSNLTWRVAFAFADHGDFDAAAGLLGNVDRNADNGQNLPALAGKLVAAGQGENALNLQDDNLQQWTRFRLQTALMPELMKSKSSASIRESLPDDTPLSFQGARSYGRRALAAQR